MVCRNPKTAEEAKTEIINSTNNEVVYLEYLLKYTHSVYKMSCLILVLASITFVIPRVFITAFSDNNIILKLPMQYCTSNSFIR